VSSPLRDICPDSAKRAEGPTIGMPNIILFHRRTIAHTLHSLTTGQICSFPCPVNSNSYVFGELVCGEGTALAQAPNPVLLDSEVSFHSSNNIYRIALRTRFARKGQPSQAVRKRKVVASRDMIDLWSPPRNTYKQCKPVKRHTCMSSGAQNCAGIQIIVSHSI
jgi:hypothetical protein